MNPYSFSKADRVCRSWSAPTGGAFPDTEVSPGTAGTVQGVKRYSDGLEVHVLWDGTSFVCAYGANELDRLTPSVRP